MAKKALLIGINDYAPIGVGGPDLRGCVNDVRDLAHTLNALSVVPAVPGSMKIITDGRATRTAILSGLRWLVTGAKKGDTLIFHYSGHGSQVLDTNGDEPIDKKDETICPHDYSTAGMIKDDDLRGILRGVTAGVNLDVILDSCHSGTGTKELAAVEALPGENQIAYRYIEPPIDYGFFLDSDPSIRTSGLLKGAPGERNIAIDPGLNHVLWAACRANQTSAETAIGGVWRGVFTYCFCQALRRAGLAVTRRKLDALVSADLRRMGFGQIPQLEGTVPSLAERVFT